MSSPDFPPDLPADRKEMLSSLPPAASRALGQMLNEDPAKRPATADACRKALADARRALNAVPAPRIVPTVPRTVEPHYSTPLPARPRKRATRRATGDTSDSGGTGKLIAAAVVILMGCIWVTMNRGGSAEEAKGAKETVREDASPADSRTRTTVRDSGPIDSRREEKKPEIKESPPPREKEIASTPVTESVVVPAPDTSEPPPPIEPPPIDPALIPLRKKYVAALTNAVKSAEQAKEAPRLLALRTELELIEKGGSPPDIDVPGTPSDLAKLRAIYRKEAEALTSPVVTAPGKEQTPPSSGKPPIGMPGDAVPFNGKWYRYYLESPTWHAAKEKCERLNGRLAVVPDQETWTFVKGIIGSKWTWLGATEEKSEAVWTWVDGTAMTLKKWQSGEPNNRDAKQHYLKASSKGWRDDEKQPGEIDGYLCEWLPQ